MASSAHLSPNVDQSLPISPSSIPSSLPHLNSSTGNAGSSSRKRTRGTTKNRKLTSLAPGQKLPLEFNNHNQVIGLNANVFASYLGKIVAVCEDAPITCKRWEDVPQANKDKMYSYVLEKFEFEENEDRKNWIIRKMGNKFANYKYRLKVKYYNTYTTDEERIQVHPVDIDREQWRDFVHWLSSPEFQATCTRNKDNRSKLKMSKTTGTRSFARVRAEEAQKLGRDPTEVEMFYLTHKKKDGSMVDSTAAEIVENIQTIATQRTDEQPSEPVDENQIFLEVMGKERHGRVRGYGFGATPSSVFGKLPHQSQLVSTVETLKQENKDLREKLSTLEQTQAETVNLVKSLTEEVRLGRSLLEEIRSGRVSDE